MKILDLKIDLRAPLTIGNAFRFPLQSAVARRELFIGALVLLLPFVGWLLNMGHRIAWVHAMHLGHEPWPSWRHWWLLLRNGTQTWLGMVCYYMPGALLGYLGVRAEQLWVTLLGGLLVLAATVAIPGYMTHFSRAFDASEIFNPFKALRRSFQAGSLYWRAWGISLLALCLSFLGILAFGVGFLVTSVWFWQVAGYSFSNAFTRQFDLMHSAPKPEQNGHY